MYCRFTASEIDMKVDMSVCLAQLVETPVVAHTLVFVSHTPPANALGVVY